MTGAAEDAAGNPSAAADQFSISGSDAGAGPVPAAGALALLLLAGGMRRLTAS